MECTAGSRVNRVGYRAGRSGVRHNGGPAPRTRYFASMLLRRPMARYVASACFTCVSALTLVLVGVQVAQAGPSHGTAYAEWLASSAVVGQTVGLAVRTTDDLSAPGSQYPGGSFTVTYDQNTLTFAGHKNPG